MSNQYRSWPAFDYDTASSATAPPSSSVSGPPDTASLDTPTDLSTTSYAEDDALAATSIASSPRSRFSDETIDLPAAEEPPLLGTEDPPTTTSLHRDDNASPPPVYSRHQPVDSIWPATAPVAAFQPELQSPQTPRQIRDQTMVVHEAQPPHDSWTSVPYAQQSRHPHRQAMQGYGTLVQVVNNYNTDAAPGTSTALIQRSDSDAESQLSGSSSNMRRARRVKGIPTAAPGTQLCRCCCCACTCSRLTIAIILMLGVVSVLSGVGIGGKVVHTPENGKG